MSTYVEYRYNEFGVGHAMQYLMRPVLTQIEPQRGQRVLEVGCGNGFLAGVLAASQCDVVGIDLSESGIELARKNVPGARFEVASADVRSIRALREDSFDIVVSTEVVEHLYDPRQFAAACFFALRPGGKVVVTTPYHGFLKNLLLALTNGFDRHLDPLWDGGHIKFWSRSTLTRLLLEAGFVDIHFSGVGRTRWLWKSMILTGRRPRDISRPGT